ncbi:MAG: copper-binding protein [Acidobacteriota bacterium]
MHHSARSCFSSAALIQTAATRWRSLIFRGLLSLALLPLLLAPGCADSSSSHGAAGDDDVQRYEVRGEVRQVPDEENPASELMIHHEAIDDFVNWQGEVSGMDSMTMPFPVSDDEQLEGIEIGDKVQIQLEVDWDSDTPMRVVEVEEIAAGTSLEFRTARPPGGN